MSEVQQRPMHRGRRAALLLALALTWAAPVALGGDKKNKKTATPEAPSPPPQVHFQRIVFPPAPAITRLVYLDYFSAEKPQAVAPGKPQKKVSWMDRMAGVSPQVEKSGGIKPRYQLLKPYGVAVDSKNRLYVADTKVGAVFIFNTETNEVELIKNGAAAKFGSIFGLAMDDNDNLFVSDGELHHVLVFNAQHKLQATFGDDVMKDPNGMAIDTENRFLYVADTGLDQVLVYDADTYKLLRTIGTTGKAHTLKDPGNFAYPTNVAVDKDRNLYVSDTANDRVEVFDADGAFIRTWGKNGDGAGDFARPKGIAIDSDGHVWVADAMLNRLTVFTPDGHVLMALGSFGIQPGQFAAPAGLTIDKLNRVFESEQLLGRVQMFRYFTNAEARADLEHRDAEREKKAQERNSPANPAANGQTGSEPRAAGAQTAATPAAAPPTAPNPFQVMKQQTPPAPPPDKTAPPPNQ